MRGVVTKLPQIPKEIYGYLLALKSRKLSIKIWQVGCLLSTQYYTHRCFEAVQSTSNYVDVYILRKIILCTYRAIAKRRQRWITCGFIAI